ncbi:MAG: hypothetical protein JOZ39_05345 [Chloroflexi bacterium]|nr:hypothetical protein [Chloroflexota bacterium]
MESAIPPEPHFADVPGLEEVEFGEPGARQPDEWHDRGFQVIQEKAGRPPTGAGEKRASAEAAGRDRNVGLAGKRPGARAPGDIRPYEQPLDVASESLSEPIAEPVDLGAAERTFDDLRHVARGTSHTASSKGSS